MTKSIKQCICKTDEVISQPSEWETIGSGVPSR